MQLDILDRFTNHLRNTLSRSIDLAWELKQDSIPPLYLLLGLAEQHGSIGSDILQEGKLSADVISSYIQKDSPGAGMPKGNRGELHSEENIIFLWPEFSKEAKRIIERAARLSFEMRHQYIGTEHLLMAIMEIPDSVTADFMKDKNVSRGEVQQKLKRVMQTATRLNALNSLGSQQAVEEVGGIGADVSAAHDDHVVSDTPALDFFGTDLTTVEQLERLDPVIGRSAEIDRLIHVLSRRTKNNPVLIGDAGVGKTAIVEGLARRITEGNVPDVLQNKRIVSVDLSMVIAGTMYRGEFESRLRQIIEECQRHPDVILFIDEIHTLVGAGGVQGGTMDAANILKPSLAKGEIRCIGATTADEYTKYIEQDSALDRRFQPIRVEEPTPAQAVDILKGIRSYYEQYHHVTISDNVIEEAVRLSVRYLPEQRLPDKALDLIDEAGAKALVKRVVPAPVRKMEKYADLLKQLQCKKEQAVREERFQLAVDLKEKEQQLTDAIAQLKKKARSLELPPTALTVTHVAEVVAGSTGMPLDHIMATGALRFEQISTQVRKQLIGQDHAVDAVLSVIKRSSAGMSSPDRPLGSFLFLGPSGVGKTELARALAEALYGDRDALIRLDMSEFAESFTVSKLIGSPAGYVGHNEPVKLTDQIRKRPHAVVLFDEIEKAHPDIFSLLLQVLDEGRLTDAAGRELNFRNAIIIMTSNVGIDLLTKQAALGFSGEKEAAKGEMTFEEIESVIRSELRDYFPTEFLNRIDNSIVFAPLTEQQVEKIVDKEFGAIRDRLQERSMTVRLLPTVRAFIARRSFSPEHGARLVRKTLSEQVEDSLADAIVRGTIRPGDAVSVRLAKKDTLVIAKEKRKVKKKTTA